MSKRDRTAFLKELRLLMKRVPEDLTRKELQRAIEVSALALGCKLVCEAARRQFSRHTQGGGTR